MELTHHASVRMQQRGFPPFVIDWLFVYGQVDHMGGGSKLFYFNKHSRWAIENELGAENLKGYSKCLNAYMVCADGMVITVGHRFRRITRH
jgi:hypothetical protein